MAEEIKLVGSFRDEITPKLKKLNKEINKVTKSFGKMRSKLQPIAADFKKIGDAVERVSTGLNKQNAELKEATITMSKYRTQVRRTAAEQKKLKPMKGGGGGGGGRTGRASRGGGGIFDMAIGSTIGGVMTRAITEGFRIGVQLMTAPFKAFASALVERMGDEMADIQSAGGMMALDMKEGGKLFANDFKKARAMQERLNASLATSAAALPGATNDYVRAARGITDTVMMAFGKNEQAFKEFAVELGASKGASAEEAITKVMTRFTEQTVLLGMGGSKGGMPLTMLMEQLVTQDQVNISSMKRRYAQLRQNPLLATMLESAQAEINKAGAGTAGRMKAVMKALDDALPQQVVNAMRRSIEGLVESTRSAFFDPDTGLFGLSRKIKFMVEGVEVESSLFNEIRDIASNLMVPLMELFAYLSDIFDPFKSMMPILNKFKNATKAFFDNFESASKWFEDEAKGMFDDAMKLDVGSQARKDLLRQSKMLKEQSGPRGALATLNSAMENFGLISPEKFKENAAKLMDFSETGMEFDFSGMAVSLLKSFAASPIVEELVKTIGEALGSFTATIFKAIDNLLKGLESDTGTGNKLIDGFIESFQKGLGGVDVKSILSRLFDKIIGALTKAFVEYGLPAIFSGLGKIISGTWDAGMGGKALVVVGGLLALFKALSILNGIILTVQTSMKLISSLKIGATIASFKASMLGLGAVLKVALVVLLKFIAIAALVVGAFLGVVAIIRHSGYIIAFVVESVVIALNAMKGAVGRLIQGLGWLLKKATGGILGKGIEKAGRTMSEEAEGAIINSFKVIGKNTKESWEMTKRDGERLGNLAKGRGLKLNSELEKVGNKSGMAAEDLEKLSDSAKAARSTYENNIKFVDGAGKAWGWAMLNDKKIMVEWGSVANVAKDALDKTAAAADKAAEQLNKVKKVKDVEKSVDKGDFKGASESISKIYGVKPVEVPTATISPREKTSFLGEMVTGLNNWWSDRTADRETGGSPLQAPVPPSAPAPVIAAAAQQTSAELPKIAQNTAQTPPQIGKVAAYLKTLCDKVDLHGKATTAKLTETKAQIAASSNNIQAKMGEISSKFDSGINVKIVGIPTVKAQFDIGGNGPIGGPGPLNASAASMGLTMTSGYRPGDDDSYHGIDRARDYAGDPAAMKRFATFVAGSMGSGLKELIYTPLGYSIKDGKVVPPYAQDTHYDHVHVAYGKGQGQPAFFSSQKEAINWEKKMAPSNSMIGSVTSNSAEMGQPTYNQSVTVNISGAGMDDDQLSNMVAGRVLTAMQQATFTELDVT